MAANTKLNFRALKEIVAEDDGHHHLRALGGLRTLDEVLEDAETLPEFDRKDSEGILIDHSRYSASFNPDTLPENVESFQHRFVAPKGMSTIATDLRKDVHKVLHPFLGTPGLVLAGGATSRLLCDEELYPGVDLDLFVVGLDSRLALRKVEQLMKALETLSSSRWRNYKPRCWNSEGCYTITFDLVVIQIIKRAYATISEVLHSFDIGPAAVAYDGKEVYFSGLGRLAYTAGMMVLNLKRRRASYEHRLAKYFGRGFSLAIPGAHLRDFADETCPRFGPCGRLGGRLRIFPDEGLHSDNNSSFDNRLKCRIIEAADKELGEEVSSDYGSVPYGDDRGIVMHNIRHLLRPGKARFLCSQSESFAAESRVFLPEKTLYEVYAELVDSIVRGTLTPRKIRAYFGQPLCRDLAPHLAETDGNILRLLATEIARRAKETVLGLAAEHTVSVGWLGANEGNDLDGPVTGPFVMEIMGLDEWLNRSPPAE